MRAVESAQARDKLTAKVRDTKPAGRFEYGWVNCSDRAVERP